MDNEQELAGPVADRGELEKVLQKIDDHVDERRLRLLRLFFYLLAGVYDGDVEKVKYLCDFLDILEQVCCSNVVHVLQYVLQLIGIHESSVLGASDDELKSLEESKELAYPSLIVSVCLDLQNADFDRLKNDLCCPTVLNCSAAKFTSCDALFLELHHRVMISCENLEFLARELNEIGREDIACRVRHFIQSGKFKRFMESPVSKQPFLTPVQETSLGVGDSETVGPRSSQGQKDSSSPSSVDKLATDLTADHVNRSAYKIVVEVLKRNRYALGIALLSHHQYAPASTKLKPLGGIKTGAAQLYDCFTNLRFAVVRLENPSTEEIKAVMKIMSSPFHQLNPKYRITYPLSYKYFIFYTTGYGARRVFFTKDGAVAYSTVYKQFQNLFVQRYFFFDCCRNVQLDDISLFADQEADKTLPEIPGHNIQVGNEIFYATHDAVSSDSGLSFMTSNLIDLYKKEMSIDEMMKKLKKEVSGKVRMEHPVLTDAAPLDINKEKIELPQAQLLGKMLEAFSDEYQLTGEINIEQLKDGTSNYTYGELQFLLDKHPALCSFSSNLKRNLTERVDEERSYQEAIAVDGSIPLLFLKMLAIGPGQIGKSTFLKRLMGLMKWDLDTAPQEAHVQRSTSLTEMKQVYVKYSRTLVQCEFAKVDGTLTNQWLPIKSEDEIQEQINVLMYLIAKKDKEQNQSDSDVARNTIEQPTTRKPEFQNQDTNSEMENPTTNEKSSVKQEGVETTQSSDLAIEIFKALEEYENIRMKCKLASQKSSGHEQQDSGTSDSEMILINVADVGGQPAFLEILPSLTIGPAMYLIFMKLTQDIKTPYSVEFKPQSSTHKKVCSAYTYTTEEVIFSALSSIACFGHSDKKVESVIFHCKDAAKVATNSRVLLLGTYADEATDDRIEKLEDQLWKQLKETKFYDEGLIEYTDDGEVLMRVNNKSGGEEEVKEFKRLFETVIRNNFMIYEIPIKWIEFSVCLKLLAKQKNTYEISFSECKAIGESKPFNMKEDMIKVALKFLHKYTGLMLYLPESLGDKVICDPQIVCTSISKLIFEVYDRRNHLFPDSVYRKFVEEGRFSISDLKCFQGEKLLSIECMVKLLVNLNIAAQIGEGEYFFPAVLPSASIESLASQPTVCLEPLCITFKTGYLPLGFVCAVVAQLAGKEFFELLGPKKGCKILKNMVTFLFRKRYYVTLISWPKYCEFRVSQPKGARTDEDYKYENCCPLIRDTVCEIGEKVIQSLSQNSTSLYYDVPPTESFKLAFKSPCYTQLCDSDPLSTSDSAFGHESLAVFDLSDPDRTIECLKTGISPPLTDKMCAWFAPRTTYQCNPLKEKELVTVTLSLTGASPFHCKLFEDNIKVTDQEVLKTFSFHSRRNRTYLCKVSNKFGKASCSLKPDTLTGQKVDCDQSFYSSNQAPELLQQEAHREPGGVPRDSYSDCHFSGGFFLYNVQDSWNLEEVHRLKLNGEGVKIAVLDTGCFIHHKDFKDKLDQIKVFNFVKDGGQTLPHETVYTYPDNHCTAIVGLIFKVAPKATVYIMRISANTKPDWISFVDNFFDALENLIAMDKQTRPDIVSLSFRLPSEKLFKMGDKISLCEKKIDLLEQEGTVCVAAAGNFGAYQDKIPTPAKFSKVISVGSVDENGEKSGFSPKARVKVYAPGEKLRTPCLPKEYETSELTASITFDPFNYTIKTSKSISVDTTQTTSSSGTSLAAPVMAGLVALLFQYADKRMPSNGKCAKIRNCSQIVDIITSHIQPTLDSLILKPKGFFESDLHDFDNEYLF